MSFDWEKYYYVGEYLQIYSSEEEYQRSAISRYYYAYFNMIKKYYEKKYYILSSRNVHKNLIEGLYYTLGEEDSQLAYYLKKLRNYRNNADYDENFRKNNVKKAKKLVEEIRKLLSKLEKQ